MINDLRPLLDAPGVTEIFETLRTSDDDLWLVGGCVRNTLVGEPIGDIDLATQSEPADILARAEDAGLRAIPTGLDHGTVTIVSDHGTFEVTTLRKDVETDGRHAVVAFTRDLLEDAARRDFTMNALYVDAGGQLHDPQGGLADLEARRVRFIGEASERIAEDYLRILRFFRFYARYGSGPPDRAAIKAIVAGRSGLASLSPERVWAELKKLLSAPNAERALLWMRQTGVYQAILPESGDMDALPRLVRLEKALSLEPDPIGRMAVLLPRGRRDRIASLSERLRLSNAERKGLLDMDAALDDVGAVLGDGSVTPDLALYTHGAQTARRAALVSATHTLDADPQLELPKTVLDKLRAFHAFADHYARPTLPVNGQDLIDRGLEAGPQLGAALDYLEAAWKQSNFALTRDELLSVLKTPTQH